MPEVWPFIPSSVSAELGFLTDVMMSPEGEQRVKQRVLYPRLTLRTVSLLSETETWLARQLIRAADGVLDMPDYRYPHFCAGPFDGSNLTLTVPEIATFHPAVGERAVAIDGAGNAYVFTIDAKSTTITADAGPAAAMTNFYLYPVFQGQMLRPMKTKMRGARIEEVEVEVVVTAYKDLSSLGPAFSTFKSRDLVTYRDIGWQSVGRNIERVKEVFDSGVGSIVLESMFDHVDVGWVLSHNATGVAEWLEREGWFHQVQGRLNEFWKPTWTPDHVVAADASSGASTLNLVAARPETEYEGRHIFIAENGSVSAHEITVASESLGTMSCTIDPALSFDVTVAGVEVVSDLHLVRLGVDDIRLNYSADLEMRSTTPVVVQDNELA